MSEQELKLLADLTELISAMEPPLDDISTSAAFQAALTEARGRCEGAQAKLRDARRAYDSDQTENKVVALQFAEALVEMSDDLFSLQDLLRARLGRSKRASVPASEQTRNARWLDGLTSRTPSWWPRASPKDATQEAARILSALTAPDSLAKAEEVDALAGSVKALKAAYEALVRERLDDKPLSDALRVAFTYANAQRVGARSVLEGVLASEQSALSLPDLLKRRHKRAAKPTQDTTQDTTQPPPAPPSGDAT